MGFIMDFRLFLSQAANSNELKREGTGIVRDFM